MADLARDLADACRRLLRAPGFTLAGIIVLGLGIGANTSVFSVVNEALFTAVPVDDRVVGVVPTDAGRLQPIGLISDHVLDRLTDGGFTSIEAFTHVQHTRSVVSYRGSARVVLVEAVAGSYFQVLGVRPRAGRLLLPSDDSSSADVIVLSEDLWHSWFGASLGAIGQTVRLSGRPLAVVGVVPRTFRGLSMPNLLCVDAWLPRAAASPLLPSQGRFLGRVFARLRPRTSFTQADAEVRVTSVGGDPQDPNRAVALVPVSRVIMPPQMVFFLSLAGTVAFVLAGLVLLTACANLTSLLLTRMNHRSGEIAVRLALGASLHHVGRVLAMDVFLIALAGSVLSGVVILAAARWLDPALIPEVGGFRPRLNTAPDWHVVGFAALTGLAVTAAITAALVRHARQIEPMRLLGSSPVSGGSTREGTRFRAWLVGVQVAGALVMLTVAGLFVRSTSAALAFRPGFDVTHLAIGHVDSGLQGFDEARGRAAYARILQGAAGAPGVLGAALTSGLPIRREGLYGYVFAEGQHVGLIHGGLGCRVLSVSPGFFSVVGLALRRGRDFPAAGTGMANDGLIISESVARALWATQDAVGRRVHVRIGTLKAQTRVVLGVVADADAASAVDSRSVVYVPLDQIYSARVAVLVRGDGPGTALVEPLKAALRDAEPEIGLYDVRGLGDHIGLAAGGLRLVAVGVSLLGLLALVTACVGLYGVVAYLVTLRAREFGIRKAMGATPAQIRVLVARNSLRLLLLGVGPGLLVSFVVARMLRHFLVGISPHDWVTFTLAPASLILVGLVAAMVPAGRAAGVDAAVVLRES